MGPDRNTHIRNFAILILIAVAVWQLPGGGTATNVVQNILGIIFAGGLVFFGYRMYMEHRQDLFMLEDRARALLYFSFVMIALALIATSRLFDEGGHRRDRLAHADRRGRVRLRRGLARLARVLRARRGEARRGVNVGRPSPAAALPTFPSATQVNVGTPRRCAARPTLTPALVTLSWRSRA